MFKKLLGERNYFLKNFLLTLDVYAVFTATFGFLFILAKTSFESDYVRNSFYLSWLTALFIGASIVILTNGGFRIFFGLNIEHKDAFIINSFVLNSHVNKDISDKNLKELFYQLKTECYTGFKKALIYALLVVVIPAALPMIFIKTATYNIIIILLGGTFSAVLLALFSFFLSGKFTAVPLRECRKIMKDRGMEPDENVQMATLKSNFYYFVLLFAMIMIIVLSFISKPTPFLIGLVLTGFVIVVIIIQVLFSYIISVFEEIKEFASKLPREEKVEYFTSSSYKEVLELSKDLNESAGKVYEAREMKRKAVIDLENLNKSKTQFILTTEHHLRTPLTIVKGYIQATLTGSFGKIDDKLATALAKADEAANRLTALVDEFLNISQMEVGKSIFKVKAVNIKNLVADIVKELTEEINKKRLEVILTFIPKEEDNVLNLDPEKIKEVFSGVIDNAVRYNKDGGKIIIVGDKISDGGKQFFRVSVEDTGMGMDRDELEKLFTGYFERGEEAQKVYATGRGLSLTVVRSIMNAYQGRIYASSDGKGKGSKFTVEIPIG